MQTWMCQSLLILWIFSSEYLVPGQVWNFSRHVNKLAPCNFLGRSCMSAHSHMRVCSFLHIEKMLVLCCEGMGTLVASVLWQVEWNVNMHLQLRHAHPKAAPTAKPQLCPENKDKFLPQASVSWTFHVPPSSLMALSTTPSNSFSDHALPNPSTHLEGSPLPAPS